MTEERPYTLIVPIGPNYNREGEACGMKKELVSRFNTPETNLVISDYPVVDRRGENNYGIAWYTRETIEPLALKYGSKFIVLGRKNQQDEEAEVYAHGKILVLRTFDQKPPRFYPRILKWLITFGKIKNVFVHSEFCTQGGVKNFILLIPFLVLIKLFRKNVTYFAHNVVIELNEIAPHLNLHKKLVTLRLLNLGLKIYYRLLGYICDRIVVMDEEMKKRLTNFVSQEKILYAPFWIKKDKKVITKKKARKLLKIGKDQFLILYFGFITWYKGADWIIDQVKNLEFNTGNKKVKLVLAGGEAYSLKEKTYYQNYYQEQLQKVREVQDIKITGFVKEKDIEKYFQAANLVIFPYRGLIGSSGALTYAIRFEKPFLVSNKMGSILENEDFAEALEYARLTKNDIAFSIKNGSFKEVIARVIKKKSLEKLGKVSSYLRNKRNLDNLIERYYQLIFYGDRRVSLHGVVQHALHPLATK